MSIIKHCINLSKNEFNPDVIIESGQVFRMFKDADGYHAYSGNKAIAFRPMHTSDGKDWWEFQCSKEDWVSFWSDYFDLTTDYARFNRIIEHSNDEFLKNALNSASGMRILHQDLWETIITFIISQQNNIPKIKKTVEKLCFNYGNILSYPCGFNKTKTFYTFPTAEKIANLRLEELQDGSYLGYRAKYILELARAVQKGRVDLTEIVSLNYTDALRELQTIKGIGPKVANCITLYGLHHMESYPVDVWMKRIIEEDYSEYTEKEYLKYINGHYRGFQGYVQQLQFFYKRKMKNM